MTQTMDSDEVPVLIVGGSLVGLATVLFLAQHGVQALAVERHSGTAIHPRAGHLHLRTLELMRSVGLEERLQRLSAERFFPNGGINAVETLSGGEVETYIPNLNLGVEEFSPSRRLFIAQDALEPLLRERAEQLGAHLEYGSEVVSFQQDGDGITAVVRSRATGEERSVRAQYIVAADGNRSPIRNRLGIKMRGHGLLSKSATIYFRADCRELLAGTELGVIYVANPHLRGFFRFERTFTSGFLAVNTLGDPRRPGALDVTSNLTYDDAADLVRAAVGVDDLEVIVDDVADWNASAEVAERYQDGRVFLAGDSAHVVPPNGGFGGNTGIHDAHNLAWKLAMVVRGFAGDKLLETYEAERRPVGQLTIDQAFSRYRHRVTPELLSDDVPDLVDDFSMEIGYRYHSRAVLPDSHATDEQGIVGHPRDAGGRPGTRAPHVNLGAGGSTLDLFGAGFVLLTGPDGQAWAEAAVDIGRRTGLPLQAHVVTSAAGFTEAYGVDDNGAVLVRPDGFVSWRSRTGTDGCAVALEAALIQLLVNPEHLALLTP